MYNQKCISYIFLTKYCSHRWLENITVIDCIIKTVTKIKIYSNEKKKDPDTKTYKKFKADVNDFMLDNALL